MRRGTFMQYNFHNEKYQLSSIGGIHAEQFREYRDEHNYKNYVDCERTSENMYKALSEDGMNWSKRVRQAIKESATITGRKVRKDAVVLCSTVESVPESWPTDICKKYFEEKAEWYKEYLHEHTGIPSDAMLSLACHFDESTPHATIAWIPIKDGKLQAKNITTKIFYKQLQSDSQAFTFDWIEHYNEQHEQKIEKLEPYVEGSMKKHLQEQEYKEKKIADHVQQLEAKHDELSEKVSDTIRQHQEISEQLSNAKAELEKTQADTAEVLVAGKLAKQQIQESKLREQDIERREKRITEITGSPSIASYDQVRKENDSLKNEISLKDKLIESLQQTIDSWKLKIRHLGKRMASALGFREEEYAGGTQHVSEFPDTAVKEAYESAVGIVQDIDPRSLRVIPDQQHSGFYTLASKDDDGKYKIQESGFATRELADQRRRDLMGAKDELDRRHEKSLNKYLTR